MSQKDAYVKPLDVLTLTVRTRNRKAVKSKGKGSLYLPIPKSLREIFQFEEGETLQLKLMRRFRVAELVLEPVKESEVVN